MYRGGAARGRPLSDVRALTRGGSVAHWCNGGSLGRSPHCHVTSGTRSCVRLQLKRPVDRRAGHCTQPSVVLNSSSSSRESVRRVIECVFVQLSRMWGFVQRFVGHRGFYRFDSTIHLRPQATNDNECGGVRSQRTSADTQCILRMHAHTTRNTQLTCSHVQLGFKLSVEAGGICLLQHRADKVLTQMRPHDWAGAPYAPRGSLGLECMQCAPYAPRGSWASNACDSPSNEAVCGAYGGGGEASSLVGASGPLVDTLVSRADITAATCTSSFCWLTMSGMSCMRDRSAIVGVLLPEAPMTPAIAGRAPPSAPSARDEPSVSEE